MQKDRDFLIKIAQYYYIQKKSQQEIADEFSIPRPTVSNLLKLCRETGIVEIRVKEGSPETSLLGDAIKKKYGLRKVVVIPSTEDTISLFNNIGKEAAFFTNSILRTGLQIGIAWGTTLYQMVHQIQHQTVADSSVVQLMGGFGASNPQYDGSDLARELSKRLESKYFPLQCPVIVKNEAVKDLLMDEPWIRKTLEMTKNLDIAFVGISSNQPEKSSLVKAGFLSMKEAYDLYYAGAVGHLCGYSYDKEGNWMDVSTNHRIIGISFSNFLQIPERVGIACGSEKAEAIQASLVGGHLTTLITDQSVAARIVNGM